MDSERWRKIQEIFEEAIEIEDPAQVKSFLERVCADDEELKNEVKKLLKQDSEAESLMNRPLMEESGLHLLGDFAEEIDPLIGEKIGNYQIIKEIGHGGMGEVYLAERIDGEFEQKVAVKLIKRGMDTRFILRRFRQERQILASLEHPYIALLLNGGTTEDNLPYFIMEFIEGEPLFEYCNKQNLDLNSRLKLFQKVCEAVDYAHTKKVIHRDLKPSNVLINRDGTPKLLDFGIAKVFDSEIAFNTIDPTVTAMRMMTPEYASPEQIKGETVTPASDIYSLGILLYELLTGKRPYHFPNRAPHEIARVICEQSPQPIADLGNLEKIIFKTLQKNPAERYQSVKEFNQDITNYFDGKPISTPIFARLQTVENKNDSPKSIAVLPLRVFNLTTDDGLSDEFLSIGLADAIITRLSGVNRLAVRPTSAALKYSDKNADLLQAGQELAVDFVLEGNLKRAGNKVRVSLKLLEVEKEINVWANQFDEEFTDALELEEKISEQVAEAIIPQLTTEEIKRLKQRGTVNPKAHECYLRGRYFWNQFTGESLQKAIKEFETAIELDPNYALPYVGVADFYNWISIVGVLPSGECLLKAKESAQKALELDDSLGEAYVALFFPTLCYDLNWVEAERLALRAIELSPNYSYAYECYSYVLTPTGRFAEGLKAVQRAEELEPLSPRAILMTSWTYYQTGHFAEALAKAESTLNLDKNFPQGYMHYGNSLQHLGRAEEGIIALSKCVSLMPEAPIPVYILCHALVASNRLEEAKMLVEELKKATQKQYVKPYFMAMSHVALGEFDEAFEWFEKGLAERDQWFVWLGTDPKLNEFRKDPRFLELFRKTNNPWANSFN
ncbi:MAG: protein kinase [Pyrinomonadaceae bacterium]|nr:protein kinase [Pyrinomonadaceae bacterium]